MAGLGLEVLARLEAEPELASLAHGLFVDNERLLRPMMELLAEEGTAAYLEQLRDIWSVMRAMGEATPEQRIAEALRGLQFHSVEFLRRQARFEVSGRYQADSAATVYEEVYRQPGLMSDYLDGLLLSYVAWPNHYRLLRFFRERYLSRGPHGRCLEIGPGHGWLALQQLRASSANTLMGVDISPWSVAYARQLLSAAGVPDGRYEIREVDAALGVPALGGPLDRIVLAEVLEHVEDPEGLLSGTLTQARSGALVFISTVVNIEAVDHLYLFRSLDEVRTLLAGCGVEVVEELALPLAMAGARRPSFQIAAVGVVG